jgi:NADPH:quinone reductase-like Zn-dependent oxidoreductase
LYDTVTVLSTTTDQNGITDMTNSVRATSPEHRPPDTQSSGARTTTTTKDDTMQAVVQKRYGSAEQLSIGRLAKPTPGAKDVLVRVRAAGLDRGTWHLMTGKPYLIRLAMGFRGPRNPVPGRDVAGIVEAVGPEVTRFSVDDEVYGIAPGSFAEYAVAREDKLDHKPVNLTFEQAAVVPVSAATALQAVYDLGRVETGQQVLIIGASGGVGTFAVQLAKARGAVVTGVASIDKLDLVRSLGADQVIDYTREDFAEGEHLYDVIIDIGGNPTLSRLRRALTPTGTAVLTGGEEGGNFSGGMNRPLRGRIQSLFTRQRMTNFINRERGADLHRLTELLEAGQLVPSIDRTYPIDEVPQAMRHLEAGNVRGKVAITIPTEEGRS